MLSGRGRAVLAPPWRRPPRRWQPMPQRWPAAHPNKVPRASASRTGRNTTISTTLPLTSGTRSRASARATPTRAGCGTTDDRADARLIASISSGPDDQARSLRGAIRGANSGRVVGLTGPSGARCETVVAGRGVGRCSTLSWQSKGQGFKSPQLHHCDLRERRSTATRQMLLGGCALIFHTTRCRSGRFNGRPWSLSRPRGPRRL